MSGYINKVEATYQQLKKSLAQTEDSLRHLLNNPSQMLDWIYDSFGDDTRYLGIRGLHESAKVGEILEPSNRWDDGDPTDEVLSGTCALQIGDVQYDHDSTLEMNIKECARHISQYNFGHGFALIEGSDANGGEDIHEVVIKEAKVLYVWKTLG